MSNPWSDQTAIEALGQFEKNSAAYAALYRNPVNQRVYLNTFDIRVTYISLDFRLFFSKEVFQEPSKRALKMIYIQESQSMPLWAANRFLSPYRQ